MHFQYFLTRSYAYLKWAPKSRLGAKGRLVTIVVPLPVAEKGMVCVSLFWMDRCSLSWKCRVSSRWATSLSSSFPWGGTSPSLGSTRHRDLLRTWKNTVDFCYIGSNIWGGNRKIIQYKVCSEPKQMHDRFTGGLCKSMFVILIKHPQVSQTSRRLAKGNNRHWTLLWLGQ